MLGVKKRNPAAKWVLPVIVDPPDTICVQIKVPREAYHIAAFRGALLNLSSAYKWSDDVDHTAKQVARVWRDVIDNITVCEDISRQGIEVDDDMAQFRQTGCVLEVQCANGDWETLYDPTDCIKDLVTKGSSQLSPAGSITEDTTVAECLIVAGNGKYIFPFSVSPGDTVVISASKGGWYGGDLTEHWYCPDGNQFVFGICAFGGDIAGSNGEMPSENFMRLIAEYDGVFYDAFDATFTIPDSATESDLVFQANDTNLTNNAGSVSFCAAVTHHAPVVVPPIDYSAYSWVIDMDLENVDYSYLWDVTDDNGNVPKGYVVGTGITSGDTGWIIGARLKLSLAGSAADIRVVDVETYTNFGDIVTGQGLRLVMEELVNHYDTTDTSVPVAGSWETGHFDSAAGYINVSPVSTVSFSLKLIGGVDAVSPHAESKIRKVTIAGNGAIPTLIHW